MLSYKLMPENPGMVTYHETPENMPTTRRQDRCQRSSNLS